MAHNQFVGILPSKLFASFKDMTHVQEKYGDFEYMRTIYYHDSVDLMWKGKSQPFQWNLKFIN